MKLQFVRSVRLGVTALGLAGAATAWAIDKSVSPRGNMLGQQGIKATGSPGSLSHQDVQFFNDAAKADVEQITLGCLAIEKGATDAVKEYGRQLIDSHVKSLKNLMDLASRKDVFIPISQMKLPIEHLAGLEQKPGRDFDKAFIVAAVNAETRMQSGLQRFLGQVTDSDIRDFANQMLSNTSDQLSDARDLGGNLGIAAQELNPPPPVGEEPAPESTPVQPEPSATPAITETPAP